MKTSGFAASRTGLRHKLMVLAAVIAIVGPAAAQIYQHGNSTTIIEQSGSGADSETQVEHFPDGQRIITQDGNSTDITIQREGNAASSDSYDSYADDDDSRQLRERFSRSQRFDQSDGGSREDFGQRMHERMRGDY